MPTVTRGFSIAYAGLTLGGSSDYYLLHCDEGEAPIRLEIDYPSLRLEAYVVVRSTSVSDFTTRADALETAFKTPAGDLSYTFGSTTTSYSQSGNTGMNAEGKAIKVGSLKFDSDRSRLYLVSVSLMLPASASGKNGLRKGSIRINVEANGRKTANISGSVTALPGVSATAQYATCIAALVTEVTTALSATMESVDPQFYDYDDRNKVVVFSHTLREIIFSQSAGGLDHVAIKDQQLEILRAETYPGDHDGNAPPVRVVAQYSATIDKAQTTDLVSLWGGTIKPWILQRMRAIATTGNFALVDIPPRYDLANNRISATVVMIACLATTWGHRVTTSTYERTATQLVPVWNGNPFARQKYQTYATRRVTITEDIIRIGGGSAPGRSGGAAGGAGFFGANGGGSAALGQLNVSFGFFGASGNSTGLGQINVVGGGAAGGSSGSTQAIGGVTIPKGYELLESEAESFPTTVGAPEQRFTFTAERKTQVYEYAELVTSPGGSTSDGRTVSGVT